MARSPRDKIATHFVNTWNIAHSAKTELWTSTQTQAGTHSTLIETLAQSNTGTGCIAWKRKIYCLNPKCAKKKIQKIHNFSLKYKMCPVIIQIYETFFYLSCITNQLWHVRAKIKCSPWARESPPVINFHDLYYHWTHFVF